MKRSWIRAFSLILALALACAAGALSEGASGSPNIPIGGYLENYVPERDGYFGLIPFIVPSGDAAREGDLAALVFGGQIYVDLDGLNGALEDFEVDSGASRVAIRTPNRSLEMAVGSREARFRVFSRETGAAVVVDRSVGLSCAPIAYRNRVWSPLTDALALLGVDCAVGMTRSGRKLLLAGPERAVIDVLADLNDPQRQRAFLYAFPDIPDSSGFWLQASACLSITVDRVMSFSVVEILRMLRGTNIVPLMNRVLALDRNEFMESACQFTDAAGAAVSLPEEITGVETAFKPFGLLMDGISALEQMAGHYFAFKSRDRLAVEAMELYSRTGPATYIGAEVKKTLDSNVRKLGSDTGYAFSRAVEENWPTLAVDIAGFAVEAVSAPMLTSAIYRLAESKLLSKLDWWSGTKADMEALQDSAYALPFQEDVRAFAGKVLPTAGMAGIAKDQEEDCMKAAYLFLKTCTVTREISLQAIGLDENVPRADRELLDNAYRDMAILSRNYGREDWELLTPDGIVANAASASGSGIAQALIPLYMTLDGQVLEKETKAVVEDATVHFEFDGHDCGYILETPESLFRKISVPMDLPDCSSDTLREKTVLGRATSPTVPGEGTSGVPFDGGATRTMSTIYLGDDAVIIAADMSRTHVPGAYLAWFSNFDYPGMEKEIVTFINRETRAATDAAKSDYKTYTRTDASYDWEVYFAYGLRGVYSNGPALCMELSRDGVDDIMNWGCLDQFNLDLEDRAVLTLTDVFDPDNPGARDALRGMVADGLWEYAGELTRSADAAAQAMLRGDADTNWRLTWDGLEFYTSPEAPGSLNIDRMMFVTIPYDRLQGVLAPKYLPDEVDATGSCYVGTYQGTEGARRAQFLNGSLRLGANALYVDDLVKDLTVSCEGGIVFYASKLRNACVGLPPLQDTTYTVRYRTATGEQQLQAMPGQGGSTFDAPAAPEPSSWVDEGYGDGSGYGYYDEYGYEDSMDRGLDRDAGIWPEDADVFDGEAGE